MGKLKDGDYLIVDNASVHVGSDAFPWLTRLLDVAGVRLIFLPKYSPELNPCEGVFALVKSHLRCWRGNDRFWQEIIKSLGTVTYLQMFKCYEHSITL